MKAYKNKYSRLQLRLTRRDSKNLFVLLEIHLKQMFFALWTRAKILFVLTELVLVGVHCTFQLPYRSHVHHDIRGVNDFFILCPLISL